MIDSKERLSTRPGEVAAKVIDGEAILINLTSGLYYSMGAVGGRIWSLIERGHSVDDISAAIASEFDVPADTARADVESLVEQLVAEELVDVQPAGNGATQNAGAVEITEANNPYTKPELNKFDDMAEMFALDPPLPGAAKAPNA